MKLRGCGTALVTPFKRDGSLDEMALRQLVRWQVDSGIDFLLPCGTTGETPTLSHGEWLRVIDVTIDTVQGRVPIMAGATSNNTQEAVARVMEISTRKGVDFILTATPYYNKPTQEGVFQHFRAIAEVSKKPALPTSHSAARTAPSANVRRDLTSWVRTIRSPADDSSRVCTPMTSPSRSEVMSV